MGTVEEENANKRAWAQGVHQLDCRANRKSYDKHVKRYIASGVTMRTCRDDAHKMKCRYNDIPCIDQTRVVLKNRDKDDDFIHANWVFTPAADAVKYICTQAPLKETQDDFWHMCFSEKVSLILMLCDFKEGSDLEKSSHYFPEIVGQKLICGAYKVTLLGRLDEPELAGIACTIMKIECEGETMVLKHCVMRDWIDYCAPVETERVLKLWRWVHKHHEGYPVVVHSSAGVGRAATFVGIDLAIYRIKSNAEFDMFDVMKELRAQRYGAIHSHVQLLYLYCLVVDAFVHEKTADAYTESKMITEYKRHTAKRIARAMKLLHASRSTVSVSQRDPEADDQYAP